MAGYRLLSLQVGLPRTHGHPDAADPMDRPWRTGYFKEPVAGPVFLHETRLEGDGQVYKGHGGPQMAVLGYSAEHYPRWREETGLAEMGPGGFGENFTIEGLDEHAVCLGDVLAIGEARLQVSMPRGPCANISRRWKRPELMKRVVETGRTGWYYRVLRTGLVQAGQTLELLERPHPDWSIARVQRVSRLPKRNPEEAQALAALEALAPQWREKLSR
jgi:MOSC domain-containing protein YiiM